MRLHRIALLLREFPFLAEIARIAGRELREFSNIVIKHGDAALLGRKQYAHAGAGDPPIHQFYAVAGGVATPLSGFDSVGEELFELRLVLDFIVEDAACSEGHENELRIYKMRGFDLAAHHAARIDEAAAELKAEIAAVCAAMFPANLFVETPGRPLCFGVLAAPPVEETRVGYRNWVDTNDPDNYRSYVVSYFVLPDGGAKIIHWSRPFSNLDDPRVEREEKIFAPGTWAIKWLSGSFGSHGGREIVRLM